ncbi:tRNA pseudouridine synthase 1 [Coemansia nantahalensis]|uniref:tRNA pseudouridine synthase 1 n=1 Tax=Coemansia nantahalensis TaxID=2789366 RepID=A0ACC1JSB0_9FUNG|nr:tRNA pseudouridine synthase 1 [Coemansia nantahalensis]
MSPEANQVPSVAAGAPAGAPAEETPDNKRKRSNNNRAQTGKDRREHAKRKYDERRREGDARGRVPRGDSESSEPRQPKRRVALLLGYCGTGYQGMQVNPGARTIESDLFKALCGAGAVSEDNASDQHKVQLQRAARTDKGVHAAGQVVSLKMIVEDPDIVAKINQHLPAQIRAWGFVRTVRSFNSKTMCDSRIYEYLLPTYVFMAPSQQCQEIARTVPIAEREVPAASPEEIAQMRAYRLSPETLQFVRDALAKYKGTHDYRNFTVTKGCTEHNSKRHMFWFEAADPMVVEGSEWLSLKVKGQSFMLHQIRKMVGLIILMARAGAPLSLMDRLFGGPLVNVPKAPGLGLLLEQPVFDGYNQRTENQATTASGVVTFEPHKAEIDAFKQEFIYDNIVKTELAECTFDSWVKNIEVFPEQFTYINKEGVIPESAIIVPGQSMFHPRDAARGPAAESSDDEQDANDG